MSQQDQLKQLAIDLANTPDEFLRIGKLTEARANLILGYLIGLRDRANAILKENPK